MTSKRQILMKDETAIKGIIDRLKASLQEKLGSQHKIDQIIALTPVMTEVSLVDQTDGRRYCARIYRSLEANRDLVRQIWTQHAGPLEAAGPGLSQPSHGLQAIGSCMVHLADDVSGMDLETYLTLAGSTRSEFALRTIVKVIGILEEMSEIDCRHDALAATQIILQKDGSVVLKNAGLAAFEAEIAKQLGVSALLDAAYAAPEQLAGRAPGAQTEIYQLGVLLYQMVAGRLPYVGTFDEVKAGHLQKALPNPQTLNKSVGVGLTRVLMRALGKNPKQRFASLAEFKTALGFLHPAPERAAIATATSEQPPLGKKEQAKVAKQLEEARGFCSKNDYKTALRMVDSVLMMAATDDDAIALHGQIWETMYGSTVSKYLKQASAFIDQRQPSRALAALNVALSLAPTHPQGLSMQGHVLESYRDRHCQFPAAIHTKNFLGQAVEAKTTGNLILAEGLWTQVLLVPRREQEAAQNQLQFEKQLAARGLKGMASGKADTPEPSPPLPPPMPAASAPPPPPPAEPSASEPPAEVEAPEPAGAENNLLEEDVEDFFGPAEEEENFFPENDEPVPLEAPDSAERAPKSKKVPLLILGLVALVVLAVAGFLFMRYQSQVRYRQAAMTAYNRADDLETSGEWVVALAAWREVVASYPDYQDPEVRQRTLELKINQRKQDILDHMRDAQARYEEDLLLDETEDNAVTHLRRILEVEPQHTEALALFETIRVSETEKAQALWAEDKIEEARATYNRLLDMNQDFKNPELELQINEWVDRNVVAPALKKMDRALKRKRWDEAREIGDNLISQINDAAIVQVKWDQIYSEYEKRYNTAQAKNQTKEMLDALEVMTDIRPENQALIERKDKLSRDLNLEKIESLERQIQEASRKKQRSKALSLAKKLQRLDSKNSVATKAVDNVATELHDQAESQRRVNPRSALASYRELIKIRNWKDYQNEASLLSKRIANFDSRINRFRKQANQPPQERKQAVETILREFDDFVEDPAYKDLQGMIATLETEDQRLKKMLQWESQARDDNGKTYAVILAQLKREPRFTSSFCEQKRTALIAGYQSKIDNYEGAVVLRVVSASNLPKDKRSEVFCRVETGIETFETPSIKRDDSPQWKQVFNYTAKPGKPLVFSVFQKRGRKQSLIGAITLSRLPESTKNLVLKPKQGNWTLTVDIKRQR